VEIPLGKRRRKFDLKVSDGFWDEIERFRQNPEAVLDRLTAMSRVELKRFYRDCDEATAELLPYDHDPQRGFDEEDIRELSAWVVSQGKDFYRQVWDDPALLPASLRDVELCNYAAVAADLFEKRFNEELF
jgi:hypothetical protein